MTSDAEDRARSSRMLVALLNAWDPLGRLSTGEPLHGYGALAERVVDALEEGVTAAGLAARLFAWTVAGHSDLGAWERACARFAAATVDWRRRDGAVRVGGGSAR